MKFALLAVLHLQALIASSLADTSAVTTTSNKSFVRGVTSPQKMATRRMLKGEKRSCEFETSKTEVEFECESEVVEGALEIEDEVKYSIEYGEEGVVIEVKYEQSMEYDDRRRRHLVEGEGDEMEEEKEELGEGEEKEDEEKEDEEKEEEEETDGEQQVGQDPENVNVETETKFEVLFTKAFEYIPTETTNGRRRLTAEEQAYQPGDQILSEVLFSNWGNGFDGIETKKRRRLEGDDMGGNEYKFSLTTDVATFDFTIAEAGEAEAAATANKMQADVRINGYPWTSPDSFIALETVVKSKEKIEVDEVDEDSDDEDEEDRRRRLTKSTKKAEDVRFIFSDKLAAKGLQPLGSFTWAKKAEATTVLDERPDLTDGDEPPSISLMQFGVTEDQGNSTMGNATTVVDIIEVIATSSNEDGDNKIYFSFTGSEAAHMADELYWDPEAGIDYTTATGSSAMSVVGGAFALAMAGALAILGW